MLSRLAREFAAEIADHDWSDAPYRLDRAGHQREFDSRPSPNRLENDEIDRLRTNVAWVVGQVLAYSDPNFDINEFVTACGVPRSITHRTNGSRSGMIVNGLRWRDHHNRVLCAPGAPLWKAKLLCDVGDRATFERQLGSLASRSAAGPGIDPSIDSVIDSATGRDHLVTLVVRAWDSAAAEQRAKQIAEAAISAAHGGTATSISCDEFTFTP
ncbi:hypothetical protein ABFV47_14490 [Mycolicibacterium fortuitum]|uniref:hypothetical protein n=1 Tax=Mycolicibacterium TaxID=1866885 RepID=UPI003204AB39